MRIPRRRFLHLAGAATALSALPRAASAQTYPSRTITMIVPYAPGGPTDTVGRVVAERMRAELGQAIVLENVSGAAGGLGLSRLARASADGYTIDVGNWSAHVINGALYDLAYDLKTDFEPIALLSQAPLCVLSSNAVPAQDLKGLIAWMKANPGKASIGTAGVGSPPHVGAVLFMKLTGTDAKLVSYRGAAPAVQDLMSGQIDMVITDPTTSVPQILGGTIRGYAVASPRRLAAAPNLPTADEAGLPGFYVSSWNALFAPKGTPKDIIAKLNAAAVTALADPKVRTQFSAIAQEIPPREQQTPEALGALVKSDIEKWWPLIKAANMKPE
jgi:tripartite-type tricarboxylate transporter receptor subunit TctC